MKWLQVGVPAICIAVLVSGCASDPKDSADAACAVETKKVSSYNEAMDGGFPGGIDKVGEIRSVEITEPATEVPEGGAFNVRGTAEVVTESGRAETVHWRCFSQTNDGKTYASLVQWF